MVLVGKERATYAIYLIMCKTFDNVSLSTKWECVDLIDWEIFG